MRYYISDLHFFHENLNHSLDCRGFASAHEMNEYIIEKWNKTPKYKTRAYTRCRICGRPHAVLKKYGICRICFRELAYKGQIPGCKKASW